MLSTKEREIRLLLSLSARIGRNPLLAQASSGNTSLKRDGVLWIKASGKWLADAEGDEILVPIELEQARRCLSQNAEIAGTYPSSLGVRLRASVETAMHAVIPNRVVVHVHSINAIARAVLQDASSQFSERLYGLPWGWIPYVASGIPLAREISNVLSHAPQTQIFVLGNHGLVLCGDTCEGVERLLDDVEQRLGTVPRQSSAPRYDVLARLTSGSDWRLPHDDSVHALGTDKTAGEIASRGVLYPCQAIFLGGTAVTVPPFLGGRVTRLAKYNDRPFVIVEGCGVVLNNEITEAEEAMLIGFAQVIQRIDRKALVRYLSEGELGDLLKEDTYRYRDLAARSKESCPAPA